MSDVFTSAGTTLGVSSTLPATYDQSGYAALTFVAVGEIIDMGEFGKTYNIVNHSPISERAVVKRKGSYNEGALALQLGRVPGDAGQTVLIAALASDNSYAFEIVLNDAGASTATTMYFTGQVASYTTSIGAVDSITSATCNIEIDRPIVEIAAT